MGGNRESAAKNGAPLAIILHDSRAWGPEDHAVLREYLEAHRLLPPDPHLLPEDEIAALGRELMERRAADEQCKRVLLTLAHHRSPMALEALQRFLAVAAPEIERFARFAVEEGAQWVHTRPDRNEPCPCGSGLRFRKCCALRSVS